MSLDNRFSGSRQNSSGLLKIQVLASQGAKPVEGAIVKVTETQTGKQLDELITNSSGETALGNIVAPPMELTEEPETTEQPYSELNLEIVAKGYNDLLIEGVQIFSETTAIQNANLTGPETESEIIIAPHTLWGTFPEKIPESEKKPLNAATGFVVLDKPVIPQYIVVHTGKPTSPGKDYWIPFKDYIKNVASCEIYSTWPKETIKANVLAILSFTLNRVFTEWYRNKGYNFTITNSTAYDQAFSYGRTIYKQISVVVDEIFTTYITKPNFRQPLFAQYCNGSTSTCPKWLSQWGSKSLGDKGYSAINILKNYYGSDIFLQTATKVNGVPMSYPGAPLKVGSRGNSVKTIQNQLNVISKNFPAIPKVKEDGIYGPATKNSVEVFQRTFNLPVTGIVDFATWYKISSIYVAVTKMT